MASTIVIFGASGDLTSRKLVPALYRLFQKKRLPPEPRIVGFARSKFSSEEWRNKLEETTKKFTGRISTRPPGPNLPSTFSIIPATSTRMRLRDAGYDAQRN